MKLGICYNVFEGEELLPYAINSIRKEVDYVSVVFQSVSYHGNPCHDDLLNNLTIMQKDGLIDQILFYDSDLSKHNSENERNVRNLGLDSSISNNCTHHISADCDEFYELNQLIFAKKTIENEGFDGSVVYYENYFKNPQWQIIPSQNYNVSFIHSVKNRYEINTNFPFPIDLTRRYNAEKFRIFNKNEFLMHHMTFVRKNIERKVKNNANCIGTIFKVKKFLKEFHKYSLGDRTRLPPDYINRKTKFINNSFNIKDF